MWIAAPWPQQSFYGEAQRALVPAPVVTARCWLLPNGGVREDAALQPFKQREGESVRRDESNAATVGAAGKHRIGSRVKRQLVDARAGQRPTIAATTEAGKPRAMQQNGGVCMSDPRRQSKQHRQQ